MSVIAAFILRDFRNQKSYRLQFFGQIFGLFLSLLTVVFLSRLIPGNQPALRPYGDYFTFALIGTSAATFFTAAIGSFSDSLGREQGLGTLEAILVTPNDPRLLLLGGAAWPFVFGLGAQAIYILIGIVVFGAQIQIGSLLLLVVVLFASMLSFFALGLVSAAVLIRTKRGTLIQGFLTTAFTMFGGVYYPVSVFPGWLQALSHLLPMTYGINAARQAVQVHPDMAIIGADLLALAAFTVVLMPASLILFQVSINRARREGSLAQY